MTRIRESLGMTGRVHSVNTGTAERLRVGGGRTVLSGIRKTPVTGDVAVGPLGLTGDEQVDLSVHGGLQKAVYAYPVEHLPFWQAARRTHGVSLFDEALPPGFMGENLLIEGVLEHEIWVGDTLQFAHCALCVTAPREPCGKFAAVMGFPGAGRLMVQSARCGFYMAVDEPGFIQAGQRFSVVAGRREMRIDDAIRARWLKHR